MKVVISKSAGIRKIEDERTDGNLESPIFIAIGGVSVILQVKINKGLDLSAFNL